MRGHTPGPWAVDDNGNVVGADANGTPRVLPDGWPEVVAEVYEDSDARLIAAAPDLLQALQRLLDDYRYVALGAEKEGLVEEADAAIAKATGQEAVAK